ncbi:MAG: VWA domain-containing protein, partial [Anaerolineales bacterium]|nr:VWA domain-containing protein [Anaerolineales bacterium]
MKKRHLIIFLTIILTWVTLVQAQGDDRLLVRTVDDDETPQVDDQNYPELLLELSPLNEVGIPIASLSDINFTLVDDGTVLEDVTAVPFIDIEQQVSVLVVLDVSGSMQPWLPDVKTAVEPFYLALEQWDESAVIAFTSLPDGTSVDVNALQPLDPTREWGFTNDEGALRNLINAQRAVPNAGTPLYDGVYKGIRVAATQSAHPRRAVLLVTNGADQSGGEGTTGSRIAGADIVIEESRKTGVPIFTIGLGDDVDAAFLQRAAILTGGTFMQAATSSELADAMAGVVHQLKQAYRLTATAVTPADNQLHTLSLTVSSSAGIAMETVSFNAWYPEMPQVEDVQLRLANGKQFSLETVRNAGGTLTIVPQIMSRHDIAAVNYYLNGDETAVFQATTPPWTFTWDTTTLPNSGPVTLTVEAVDSAEPPHISRYETDVTISACNMLCKLGISSQLSGILLLAMLALVLLVLVLMLVRRMRAGTAV